MSYQDSFKGASEVAYVGEANEANAASDFASELNDLEDGGIRDECINEGMELVRTCM